MFSLARRLADDRPSPLRLRGAVAVGLFLLSFLLGLHSVVSHRQIGDAWDTDEWHLLGANIAVHGTLGLEEQPTVFRPPGYPFLVGAVFRWMVPGPREMTLDWLDQGNRPLFVVQAALLALGAALLFLWLAPVVGLPLAFSVGLVFGVNPYSLILIGLRHYSVLHLFLLILSGLALEWARQHPDRRRGRLLLAGALCGAATLVRPLTLLLPAFVLAALVLDTGSWKRAARETAGFAIGLLLVVLPWTARNYRVSGALVPVNAQAWTALWAATVMPLRADPDHYLWYAVAPHYEPVFQKATGEPYSYRTLVRRNLDLERAFRREALANLESRPGTYALNAGRGFVSFNLDWNVAIVQLFQHLKRPGAKIALAWFLPGVPHDFAPRMGRDAVAALLGVLGLLALLGALVAARGRMRSALVPGALYLCLAFAHGLTHMDFWYYYAKLPFVLWFAAVGLGGLSSRIVGLGPAGAAPRLGEVLGMALAAASIGLSLWILR